MPLWTEELVLVHPHPHLDPARIRTFLVFGPGCTYRARLESWLRHTGWVPFRLLEFGTLTPSSVASRRGWEPASLPAPPPGTGFRMNSFTFTPFREPTAGCPPSSSAVGNPVPTERWKPLWNWWANPFPKHKQPPRFRHGGSCFP